MSQAQQRKPSTTASKKPATAKTTPQRKPAANQKATGKKPAATKNTSKKGGKQVAAPSIKGLQNEQQQVRRKIREQERRLMANKQNVKQGLKNLMVINSEIEGKRRSIDTIRHEISLLDGDIALLDEQLEQLQTQLDDRKQKYMKSMQYAHRNRSIQSQFMFVFSAQNFSQMYRRMRFVREYASYQKAQGEAVMVKQQEVTRKQEELAASKEQKRTLLSKGEQERKQLENKQAEQQGVVTTLQKQQKTIETILAEQRKKDEALNAQIDRLVAEEVARQKARAAAEAKKKREAELARKKAAAEAAARENARRVAEAKEKEEKAKTAARAASRLSAEKKAAAERAAREAENARKDAERRAKAEAKAHEKEVAAARKLSEETFTVSDEDRRISGSFESNKGRLPMPITGGYRIVGRFGINNVDGLKNVVLDNKGISIMGQAGARARSVFEGEVSYVGIMGGETTVMVRHGNYISVYTNLSSASVRRGQHVSTRQELGTVGSDNILQFQLRREIKKLNPELWLGR